MQGLGKGQGLGKVWGEGQDRGRSMVGVGAGSATGEGLGPLLTQLAVADAHVTLQQIVHPPGILFLGGAGLGARRPGVSAGQRTEHPGARGCLSPPWHRVSRHRLGMGDSGGPYRLLQYGRTLCPQPQRFLPTGHSAFAWGFACPCPLANHVCAPGRGVRHRQDRASPAPCCSLPGHPPTRQGHCRVSRVWDWVGCQGHPGVQGGEMLVVMGCSWMLWATLTEQGGAHGVGRCGGPHVGAPGQWCTHT